MIVACLSSPHLRSGPCGPPLLPPRPPTPPLMCRGGAGHEDTTDGQRAPQCELRCPNPNEKSKNRTGPRAGGPSSHGVAQRPSAEAQGRQGRRCGLSFRILVKTGSPHTTRPMYIFMRMASAEIKCITRASSAAAWVAA